MFAAFLIAAWLLPTAPGALNPDVTPDTINRTICVKGWTKTVRPNVDITERLKRAWLPEGHRLSDYELDHIIPLELGGAPDDAKNLWMQPIKEARIKDKLENQLNHLACHHKLDLQTAQQLIASNWTKTYQLYVGPLPTQ